MTVEDLTRIIDKARKATLEKRHVTFYMDQDDAFFFIFGATMEDAAAATLLEAK